MGIACGKKVFHNLMSFPQVFPQVCANYETVHHLLTYLLDRWHDDLSSNQIDGALFPGIRSADSSDHLDRH
jgi:hypothetical protein